MQHAKIAHSFNLTPKGMCRLSYNLEFKKFVDKLILKSIINAGRSLYCNNKKKLENSIDAAYMYFSCKR